MNNKIKDLIKECTTMECYEEGLGGGYYDEVFDKEKFAKLMIEECCSVVERQMDYDANWCDDKIKKHFGVE
jgi:hypothetical protein